MTDKVVVVGGYGFIGSAVCRRLINFTNADVVVVDHTSMLPFPPQIVTGKQSC